MHLLRPHAETDTWLIDRLHHVVMSRFGSLYNLTRRSTLPSVVGPQLRGVQDMTLCPLTKLHDWLFILDYASRYLVTRCDAPEGLDTGLMGVALIAPLWGWVIAFFVAWVKRTHNTTSFSRGFTIVTVLQIGLLFAFDRGPPTAGCGPTRAFPCPQSSIGAYVMYTEVWQSMVDPDRSTPFWLPYLTTGVLVTSIISVSTVGMSDLPAILAGVVTGVAVGMVAIWPPGTRWPVLDYIRMHVPGNSK